MKRGILFLIFLFIFVIIIGFFVRLTGLSFSGVNTCDDSDGGREYGEKGIVKGFQFDYVLSKLDYEHEDYCKDEKTLIEHYCADSPENSYPDNEKYKCKYKCVFGECVETEKENEAECSIICRIKRFFS